MSLIDGPSAIAFSETLENVYYVGIGPYIRIFQNDTLIAEHLIFPLSSRIIDILIDKTNLITYASNYLKVIEFDSDFQHFQVKYSQDYDDYVISARKFNDEPDYSKSLTIILHHGQFLLPGTDKFINPKVWKIVTSAYLINQETFLYGDSFGGISFIQPTKNKEINHETDLGTVFEVDFNYEKQEILTAHEYHGCALCKLYDDKIVTLWSTQNHPSRVWGCKFLPIGPISYGEDGCIHLHYPNEDRCEKIFHLHRTKNITALASRGNEVITGGQNGLLRHLTLFDNEPEINKFSLYEFSNEVKNKSKHPLTPFSIAVLENNVIIVGTFGGSILSLPDKREIVTGNDFDAWYLMDSYKNVAFGASRSHHHFVMRSINEINIFTFPSNCSTVSLACNLQYFVAAYSDNKIRVYNFDGTLLIELSFSDYIKRAPIAISIHHHKPIVCFGSRSSRVVVLVFNDNFSSLCNSFMIQTPSSDGFRGISFCGNDIYCAGRSDGIVSILGETEDHKYALKSSWRIAAQCKSTIGIHSISNPEYIQSDVPNVFKNCDERPIVSVMTKEGIALWDINTQTMVSQQQMNGTLEKLTIQFTSNCSYSLAYIDSQNVFVQTQVPSVPAFSIGVPFHGLKGLCMTKSSTGDLLASGGCDRDVLLWRLIDHKLVCVESLQAVDSGTHAVCFYDKESLLFAGGSKEFLYVWKLQDNDKLFRLNIFLVGDNKFYKLRVTTLTVTDDLKLFIGMSDASIRIFDYSIEKNELIFKQKIELKGVPISSSYTQESDVVTFSTSTGDVYWIYHNDKIYSKRLCNNGVYRIRTFLYQEEFYSITSSDDGNVIIWRIEQNEDDLNENEILKISKGHTGGVKALAMEVKDNQLRLLSFSYDQKAVVYIIDLDTFRIIKQREYPVSVSDGIACEFVQDGFVVFGFAIQYIKTEE